MFLLSCDNVDELHFPARTFCIRSGSWWHRKHQRDVTLVWLSSCFSVMTKRLDIILSGFSFRMLSASWGGMTRIACFSSCRVFHSTILDSLILSWSSGGLFEWCNSFCIFFFMNVDTRTSTPASGVLDMHSTRRQIIWRVSGGLTLGPRGTRPLLGLIAFLTNLYHDIPQIFSLSLDWPKHKRVTTLGLPNPYWSVSAGTKTLQIRVLCGIWFCPCLTQDLWTVGTTCTCIRSLGNCLRDRCQWHVGCWTDTWSRLWRQNPEAWLTSPRFVLNLLVTLLWWGPWTIKPFILIYLTIAYHTSQSPIIK